jgi:DNA-binding transcriptional MerR regulator
LPLRSAGSDTIRYYEKIGLLPPQRTPAGYRMYGKAVGLAAPFRAQRLGLTLLDVKNLLAIRDTGVPVRTSRNAAAPAVGRPRCGAGSVD